MLVEPFEMLAMNIENIVNGRISFTRIESYLKNNTEDDALNKNILSSKKPYKPKNYQIEISNLAFEYNLFSKSPSFFSIRINDLFIKPGEKVCVMGKVGSGKSSLLGLMSGQMDGYKMNKHSDYIYSVNGSISFVSQNSWLINASVKVGLE